MPKYQVQWKYKSGLGGPWERGEIVELEAGLADYVNRDSPGVLVPVEGGKLKVEGKEKPQKSKSATGKKGQDRQVKAAQNRSFVMGRDQPGYGQELLPDKDE